MKDWLIHKLGGYTEFERRAFLDDWLDERLRYQLSRKKRKTIDVYDSDRGTYVISVRFKK